MQFIMVLRIYLITLAPPKLSNSFLVSMHFLSIWKNISIRGFEKKFFWKMFFVDRDFLFQQLASLIGIVKQHIRNYLDDIFDMIKVLQHFTIYLFYLSIYLSICLSIHLSRSSDSPLQSTIILLVESISIYLGVLDCWLPPPIHYNPSSKVYIYLSRSSGLLTPPSNPL